LELELRALRPLLPPSEVFALELFDEILSEQELDLALHVIYMRLSPGAGHAALIA
jgi:hypothetical protein